MVGSSQGQTFLNIEMNRYENFDLDESDILSGNQNIVGNTYKKYNLLRKDYENKKNPKVFWKKLQRKMRLDESTHSQYIAKLFFKIDGQEMRVV